jgi:ABC-type uncharacterized transport system substrate-binding protein
LIRDPLVAIDLTGGNATGVSTSPVLEAKRLGLLRELVPPALVIGVLLNPTNPDAELEDLWHDLGLRSISCLPICYLYLDFLGLNLF